MAIGALEMAAAIGALYVLMPDISMSFPAFAVVYTGAVLLGIISHAPGGLGVFEATMLAIFHEQGRAEVMAGLLLYRVIYNFCPFLLATLALALEELRMATSSRAGNA